MKKYEIYGVKYKGELVYIGKSAYGMCKRKSKHKYEAYTKKFKDNFHEFIRQVGFENLEWFVIEKCGSQHDIDIKEKEYIKKFNPKYNTQEKPFYCYNVNGEYKYIGKFSNIYNTSKILNIDARKISAALQNEAITKEGYIFLRSTKNIKEEFFKRIHPYIYKRICNNHCQEISQKGFCDMIGIGKQTLYDWESGALSSQRSDLRQKIMEDNEESLFNLMKDRRNNPMKILPKLNKVHHWNMPGVRQESRKEALTADALPQLNCTKSIDNSESLPVVEQ